MVCVRVCLYVCHRACLHASASSFTQVYVFPFVLLGDCSYNTKQVRLHGITVPVTK